MEYDEAPQCVRDQGSRNAKRQEGLQMSDVVPTAPELASISSSSGRGAEPWWPRGWWKIMDARIGIIPIPVFVILFALLVGFTYTGDIKGEVSMMIAVL